MPTKKQPKMLNCDQIEATKATQIRTKLHKDVIDEYCEDIKNGAIMPEIDVFCERGAKRWILADGFQRLYATIHAGKKKIAVKVHVGGMHEALIFALGANTTHGTRRTNADKKNAVRLALKDPEISEYTQQEIADICRVDRRTVGRINRQDHLDKTDQDGKNGTMSHEPGKPESNKPENQRPTKVPPTQVQIERDEVRQANALYKALPYDGQDTGKLRFTKADITDLEYVSTWTAHAVIAYRKKK